MKNLNKFLIAIFKKIILLTKELCSIAEHKAKKDQKQGKLPSLLVNVEDQSLSYGPWM
jgi:hypothetical protein